VLLGIAIGVTATADVRERAIDDIHVNNATRSNENGEDEVVIGAAAPQSCGCGVSATISNEGTRQCCYYDSMGVPTIGIGHNLRANGGAITKYGLNLAKVLATCNTISSYQPGLCLTTAQANDLFTTVDFPPAQQCARSVAPNAPSCVSAALADMAFNLGCPGLRGFPNMLRDVNNRDWNGAAYEAGNSQWCGQVHTRCGRDQACLRSGQ